MTLKNTLIYAGMITAIILIITNFFDITGLITTVFSDFTNWIMNTF